jgi:hypothetical protein
LRAQLQARIVGGGATKGSEAAKTQNSENVVQILKY